MIMKHLAITISVILALMPLSLVAQKKTKDKKQPVVVKAEPKQEEINFENLLPSTAKVMFIDSMVVDRNKLASRISLARSAGSISIEQENGKTVYSYTNSIKNNRYISMQDTKGCYQIFRQTKKGTEWSTPEHVSIPGEYTDIICPYLMSDGVTLYFAAKGGEDNIGEYDLFFTVYDTDEEKFITPQSIGLPFNSSDDDLYYIIDEENNIGHLVTARRQDKAKVCIYTFLPTESREIYDFGEDNKDKLVSFANLTSIKATQTDKNALSQAKTRLAKVRATAAAKTNTIAFPIAKGITYYKRSDFKVEANKSKFDDYCNRKQKLSDIEIRLNALRKGYRNGQTYTKDEIITLEKEVEAQRIALEKLATEIRNAETKK